MNNYVILVGGAPTVGKTYTAEQLSKTLGIPWISTDLIRGLMKGVVKRGDYPGLFASDGYKAEEYLRRFSPQEIVNNQDNENREVWLGVKAIIQKRSPWKSFIVEGVGIMPELVHKDYKKENKVLSVFLIDENVNSIRKTVFERGLWDDASTYSDEVKEVEVEWALLANTSLKREAEKYGYPWIQVNKDGKDADLIIKELELEKLKPF